MKILNEIGKAWQSVMDSSVNPLRNYSLPTAHLIMQLLAWMWSAIFSISIGGFYLFGVLAIGHVLVMAGLFATLMVFRNAEERALVRISK